MVIQKAVIAALEGHPKVQIRGMGSHLTSYVSLLGLPQTFLFLHVRKLESSSWFGSDEGCLLG